MAYLLKNFDTLMQRFWDEPYIVFGETVMKSYSDQLIDFFTKVRDPYFILLHEDFYFVEEVDKERLNSLVEFAKYHNADRVSLQCIGDGYKGATNLYTEFDDIKIHKLNDRHTYTRSLEASIWNREFFLKHLARGEDVWATEVQSSLRARGDNNVYVAEKRTLQYRDAFIHGEQRIKIINETFHQLVPGDTWKDLNIKP